MIFDGNSRVQNDPESEVRQLWSLSTAVGPENITSARARVEPRFGLVGAAYFGASGRTPHTFLNSPNQLPCQ